MTIRQRIRRQLPNINRQMASTTWILTSSPENHAATSARGFSVIGIKERNLRRAEQIEPGDRLILYLTREMVFAGWVEITGSMFEDREPIWPGKKGNPDIYPWRFETRPGVTLEKDDWLPAEAFKEALDHVRKWPPDHWRLAFQGQLRPVTDDDSDMLMSAIKAAASG